MFAVVAKCLGVNEKTVKVSKAFGLPRTDGEGGSENHDFVRATFVNAP